MSALADKLRRARESHVEAGGFGFTIRRPTDVEFAECIRAEIGKLDFVCRFTCGWTLTELDVYQGGTGDPAPFDAEALREWIADRTQVLAHLSDAIADAYTAHWQAKEAAEKN